MEAQNQKAVAFLLSAVLTVVIIGSLIVVHEQDIAFKTFLNSLTGHHWLTKSVFAAVLFPLFSIAFYFVLKNQKVNSVLRAKNVWLWAEILVAAVIILLLVSLINYVIQYFI